jgi:hypothetical protein
MLTSSQKRLFIATSVVILLFAGFITVIVQMYVIDESPPRIVLISYNKTPKVNTSFTIRVDAVDKSRIVSAEINYRIKQGLWISDEMRKFFILCCPPRFLIRIGPFQEVGIQVDFFFRIKDSHNNELITDTYSFEIVSA